MALWCVYQAAWLADHSRVKIWEKSRRIGASWAEALYSVLQAAKKKSAGGQSGFYLSYNKDMTRQFINDCAWWAKVLGVVCGDVVEIVSDWDKDLTIFRISFASGNVIEALPSEARSLRSKQGRVIIDEAAFVDDLGELLKAAMALLMWGGQVVILSTHNGVENPFNELITDIRAGKLPYGLHHTDLDEALAGGFYKAICRKKGEEWTEEGQEAWRAALIKEYGGGAEEELFCIPSRSGGIWLSGALIEACMKAEAPVTSWSSETGHKQLAEIRQALDGSLTGELIPDYSQREFVDIPREVAAALVARWCRENLDPLLAKLPAGNRHFAGVDFGRVGDLTVIWILSEGADLHLATPFSLELRDAPFRVQEQFLKHIIDRLPRFSGVALDARGNGMQLAEYARQEWSPDLVAQVMLSEGWYRENMPRLKTGLEDKTLSLPKNATVKDDLRSIRVVRGVPRIPEGSTGQKGRQRHADSAIALALALFAQASLGEVEPWGCETAGERMSAGLLRGFLSSLLYSIWPRAYSHGFNFQSFHKLGVNFRLSFG
jgi:phage FluMu gp28-like protein